MEAGQGCCGPADELEGAVGVTREMIFAPITPVLYGRSVSEFCYLQRLFTWLSQR